MTKPEQVHFYSNYATRAACMHARLKAAAAAAPLAAIRWLVATSMYLHIIIVVDSYSLNNRAVLPPRRGWVVVVVGKS